MHENPGGDYTYVHVLDLSFPPDCSQLQKAHTTLVRVQGRALYSNYFIHFYFVFPCLQSKCHHVYTTYMNLYSGGDSNDTKFTPRNHNSKDYRKNLMAV